MARPLDRAIAPHIAILIVRYPSKVLSVTADAVMQRNASYPPAPTHIAPTTLSLAISSSIRSDISLGSISTPFSIEKDF